MCCSHLVFGHISPKHQGGAQLLTRFSSRHMGGCHCKGLLSKNSLPLKPLHFSPLTAVGRFLTSLKRTLIKSPFILIRSFSSGFSRLLSGRGRAGSEILKRESLQFQALHRFFEEKLLFTKLHNLRFELQNDFCHCKFILLSL